LRSAKVSGPQSAKGDLTCTININKFSQSINQSINFIEQKDRSATYIDMHEIHVETVKNTHVYQIQNTYTVYTQHSQLNKLDGSTLREYKSPRKLLRTATTMESARLMEQPLPQW